MENGRFPNKLRKYRHSCGYSQKKVAHILGLRDTSMLSRWEQGVALPGVMHIFRLARIYHTLPHVLFDTLWIESESKVSLLTPDESFTKQSFYV